MNKLWYPVGIIVIVIAAALLVNFGGYMGPVSGTTTMQNHTTTISSANSSLIYQQQVPILMTDPPQAPNGTSAIVMAYSNLMVHTTGGAGSGWVAANGSGTINLLSSINSTTVIGNANLSANSTVNLVRFNVSSATITVNGTIRNLTLQNRNITVALTSGSRIRTNSSLLVDFFPTIIIDSTANSTRYSMAPSARAILVTNASVRASAAIGAKVSLNAKMRAQLESSAPNVSIAAAQISSSNNTTYISVDVQNDQNSSVVISGVAIYGATSSSVNLRAAPGISIGG
ncbi:MAG TPA: hypothetical protein VNF06_03520, partial [Candidatus Aquilonibacter sp.]|nr:hypothetical protein [Candidatus Aquilonibacter sp.]